MTRIHFALGLRWITRLAGLWMVLFLLTFLGADGPPGFSMPAVGLAALYGGLAVGWFRPKWGGFISIIGWLLLRLPMDWPMLLPAAIGALHFCTWWMLRDFEVLPATPRAMAVAIFAPMALFGLLSANEILGQPPLMVVSARSAAGTWVDGETRLVIDPDGSVSGTIGAESIDGARLVANRTWFGRIMHWRSDYLIRGTQFQVFLNAESGGLAGSAEKGSARRQLRLRAL